MTYIRNPFNGKTVDELRLYVEREFTRLEGLFQEFQINSILLSKYSAEPDKPRDGHIYYADGTNWNPSHGQGPYMYVTDEWIPMFCCNLPTRIGPGFLTLTSYAPTYRIESSQTNSIESIPASSLTLSPGTPSASRYWVLLDESSITNLAFGGRKVTALDSTTIAIHIYEGVAGSNNDIDKLETWTYNGSSWSLSGNALEIVTTADGDNVSDIVKLSSTSVAVIVDTLDELRKYTWDGTDWSLSGNGYDLSANSVSTVSLLAKLDSSTIALLDLINDQLTTFSFDGTDWSKTGNSLSITDVGDITGLDSTTIAFFDRTNDELRTYTWDGTDWSQTGNSISIVSDEVSAMSSTTVALSDKLAGHDKLTWDGTDWTLNGHGSPRMGPFEYHSMTAISSTKIVVIGSLKIRTFEYVGP